MGVSSGNSQWKFSLAKTSTSYHVSWRPICSSSLAFTQMVLWCILITHSSPYSTHLSQALTPNFTVQGKMWPSKHSNIMYKVCANVQSYCICNSGQISLLYLSNVHGYLSRYLPRQWGLHTFHGGVLFFCNTSQQRCPWSQNSELFF